MVQTKLRGTTIDMLVVKLSHLCSDGAGVKEYIKLLGTIYTHLSLGRSKKQIIKEFDEEMRVVEINHMYSNTLEYRT